MRVRLRGARAADAVVLYLGTRLGGAYIRRVSGGFEEDGFPDACRRFSGRRVDCALNLDGDCAEVASYTLRGSGVVWRREYECSDLQHPFRRAPRFTDAARSIAPQQP